MAGVAVSSAAIPSAAPWSFPSALNRTFIADFEAQWISRIGPDFVANGTFKFGHGVQADIISKAAWDLKAEERFDPSSNSNALQREFGHEDVVVMVNDIIQPTWSGGDEKIVGMACHYFEYCVSVSQPRVYQHNRDCISNNMYRDGLIIGTLSPNFWEMERQFTYINTDVETEVPRPRKIPSGTRVQIPRMNDSAFDSADTAICMLTLDWEPSTFNSQHSVPFPVYLGSRGNGRAKDSSYRILHDPWVFNTTFPRGISNDGARYGCEGGTLPEDYLISTSVCSRSNTTVPDAGDIGNNNGTWIHPDAGTNATGNSTRDSPHYPWEEVEGDAKKDRIITGAIAGSVVGVMAIALIAFFLRRARKRVRKSFKETLAARTLQNDETTFGNSNPAGYSGSDRNKVVTGSLQISPPTYAEAMRDNNIRG
ncbi:hypothetical protein PMIN06_003270 [Paraphaeosphaeria minitans]